jgi:hypothetical protein
LSQIFFIAGLACFLFGGLRAWQAWETAQKYSGTAGGVADGYTVIRRWDSPKVGVFKGEPTMVKTYQVRYKYEVDGVKRHFEAPPSEAILEYVTISYNPLHPDDAMLGPVTSSWLVFTVVFVVGVFFMFVGYQFR